MNPGEHGPVGPQSLGLIVGLVVALGIVLLRNSRPRKLRIERLWIRPVIFLALMAAALVVSPPSPTVLNIVILAAALIAGAALGWQRGRFMRIEVDPATHDVMSRASPLGMVFILVLVVGRLGLRSVLPRTGSVGGVSALTMADALILLAAGMMVVQGLEMWLRARRLLTEARAAKNGPAAPPIVR